MNKRVVSLLAVILSFMLGVAPGLSLAAAPDAGGGEPRASAPSGSAPAATRPASPPVTPRRGRAPAAPRRQNLLPGQSVTQLPDGRQLLLGGESADGPRSDAAVVGPRSDKPTPLAARLRQGRAWHTATVLPDGRVLVFGGVGAGGSLLDSAELFDPSTQRFTDLQAAGLTPRAYHTATLLTDGRVLLLGGASDKGDALGDAQLWDPRTRQATRVVAGLSTPRQRHTATLTADGHVLVWGGFQKPGAELTSGELYNAESQVFMWWGTPPEQTEVTLTPYVSGALPQQGAVDVPVESVLAVRFSQPLDVRTINQRTVALSGPEGAVAARVVAAEDGRLAFVTPSPPLRQATAYSLTVDGAKDGAGESASPATLNFTTAGEKKVPAPRVTDDEQWTPEPGNLRGDWTSKRPKSEWQDEPPLQAEPGVTALAGQVLLLNGRPLADVTVGIGGRTAQTDRSGRFLLSPLGAGHHVMTVDGRSANRGKKQYGVFRIGVDVIAGRTNVLPFTSWMPRLDTDNATTIPAPTTSEVAVTTPHIPGLEVRIPAGAVVRDTDGRTVGQLSITPIPVDRPPFPLPPEVKVPVFFTVQPGASRVIPPRARVIYPNYNGERPGARVNFWNYDPEQKGWYVYGQGTVTADGRQVVPDAGVVIYEFTGFMIASPGLAPGSGPEGDGDGNDGDPVNLATGLFVHRNTDMALVDTLPIALTRTYRQNDLTSRAFGAGTSHGYDMYLVGDTFPYTYQDLVLADGSRIHFDRVSAGTSYGDAVYESPSPTIFHKARLSWNGNGWNLKLKNGSVWVFPEAFSVSRAAQSAVIKMTDRHGNTVNLTRASNGNLTKVTSPNGRTIELTYDANNRITQAQDNVGRTVNYAYDGGGRLWKVTDLAGGTTEYTYNSSHQMLTIKDPRGVTALVNEYDASGKVVKQYLADNSTYLFAYTQGADGKVTQADVTGPRGHVRRVTFNSSGYVVSDTRAQGRPEQQTITYERQPGSNFTLSITDHIGRKTAFAYDAAGNVTTVTRLAGTAGAVTVTYAYEPTFNYLASVTDALGRTTNFEYDAKGSITAAVDPLGHRTTFTYNGAGQITSARNALGHTAYFRYDAGDLVEVVDPLGNVTRQFLDEAGRLLSITGPQGGSMRYEYDAANRPLKVTDTLGGSATYSYDANGNLLSLTDPRNNTTSYAYDSMNRLVGRTDPLQRAETYAYDAAGHLTKYTDRRGKTSAFTYDSFGRRTFAGFGEATANGATTYESSISYTYDAGHRLTKVIDSAYGTTDFTFDGLNRLLSKATPQGSIGYAYDAAGRPTSMTVAGQPAVNYAYDNAGRLTGIARGASQVAIAYDDANRRSSLTLPNGVSAQYSYDSRSKLTGLTYKNGPSVLGGISYERDSMGNRTKASGSFARLGATTPAGSLTYDAANQLTQRGAGALTYDANGNLLSDGVNTYTWDARNQLASVSGGVNASFGYDAAGRRTRKTVNGGTTEYLYDGLNAVQELSGGSATANLLVGGLDEVFARTTAAGTQTPLIDGLGSTLALTDTSGSIQSQYTYDAFGNTTVAGAQTDYPFQYAGRENDGTGLYFNRARYYAPGLQRFISQDPIGFAGGINHYAYVGNNPVNLTDPMGLDGGNPFLDGLQLALDIGGMVPGLGEPLDLINAGISALRGDYLGAGLSLAGAIPFAGNAATGAKLLRKGSNLAGDYGDDLVVIGRQWDTAVAKDWPGHNVLDIPDWTIGKNDAWVQSAIDRNATVYTASPQTQANMWDSVNNRSTVYGRELQQFFNAGYRQVGDYLVPPGR